MLKVHFERQLTFLIDNKREMALMIVEMWLKAGDRVVFSELDYGHIHAA